MQDTKVKGLYKLIKHDVKEGILNNWIKYGVSIIFILYPFLMLWNQTKNNLRPTLLDYLIYFFKGMKIYLPTSGEPFEIPAIFLVFNIYLAYLIGNYPVRDLYNSAQNILVRTKNRFVWWISKCVWNIINVFTYYSLLYLVCFIFALFTGDISLKPTNNIIMTYMDVNIQSLSDINIMVATIVLPLITSVAISLVQMALAFATKPINSFIIIISLFVVSAYFYSPILIGNYPMFLRNSIVLRGGINSAPAIIVNIIISILAISLGYIRFTKMDVLDKSESNN